MMQEPQVRMESGEILLLSQCPRYVLLDVANQALTWVPDGNDLPEYPSICGSIATRYLSKGG